MRPNIWSKAARERAKKIRNGQELSAKETAKALVDAAWAIDQLERELAVALPELAALRAYKEGVLDGIRASAAHGRG